MTDREGVATAAAAGPDADMATLASGGRLNVFGFALRTSRYSFTTGVTGLQG